MHAWRPATHKHYNLHLCKWLAYWGRRGCHPFHPTVGDSLDFFVQRSVRTINTARCGLSACTADSAASYRAMTTARCGLSACTADSGASYRAMTTARCGLSAVYNCLTVGPSIHLGMLCLPCTADSGASYRAINTARYALSAVYSWQWCQLQGHQYS